MSNQNAWILQVGPEQPIVFGSFESAIRHIKRSFPFKAGFNNCGGSYECQHGYEIREFWYYNIHNQKHFTVTVKCGKLKRNANRTIR
jgi:hypothetical protein